MALRKLYFVDDIVERYRCGSKDTARRYMRQISYLGSNCALDVELFLHKMFSNYRVNGEWFDLRGAINLNEWGEYFGKIDRTGEKSDIEYIEIRDRREAANDMND